MYFRRVPPTKKPITNPYKKTETKQTKTDKNIPDPTPIQTPVYDLFNDIEQDPPARRPSYDLIDPSAILSLNTQTQSPQPAQIQLTSTPVSTSTPLPMPILHSDLLSDRKTERQLPQTIRPRELFRTEPTDDYENVQLSDTSPASPVPNIVDQYKSLFNYDHNYRNRYHQQDRKESKLSKTNLSKNLPWGDDLSLSKKPGIFRQYYQNVNGIKLDDSGGDLPTIALTVRELQCDLIGFCEIKLDVSKYQVRKQISDVFRKQFRSNRYAASTSSIPFEGTYKPGGTMTLCVDHNTGRYSGSYSDPLGRWSTVSLNGKRGRVVHFVTVYQVIHKETSGPYTAYQQQLQSLRLADRDSTPRRALLVDMEKYLTTLKGPTAVFVIMGDFNEIVGKDPSGFAKITSKFDLVDIHRHFHSVKYEVPTYARGTDRIDFVFCSSEILSAVAACGVEPFNQHIFSDHRAFFVDWHESNLFGSVAPTVVSHPQRRLQSKCLASRTKYITELYQYCEDHNIFERQQAIQENACHEKAEAIDRDITRGMQAAEAKCRLLGRDSWSITLQQARRLVDIFKHALSMLRVGYDSRYKIERLLGLYGTPLDIPDDMPSIKKALIEAQNALRQVRKDSAHHRRELLKKRIADAILANDPTKNKAAKQIARAEATQALHTKIRFISKASDQQSGLTRLEVPEDPSIDPKKCTAWTTVDTPEEITTYLLERNRTHFRQADGTPFTIDPLKYQVDFGATTEACETMLTGDYTSSDLDMITAMVVEQFQYVTAKDVLPMSISAKAMMDKYQFWPESTSTSPSGRHLGHYRSLLPTLPVHSPATEELDSKRQALVNMHHAVTDYALQNGYSYQRWKKVVNVMLEKEPGNPKIHRLRVIHIYEADYNLILGVKWRELIHHCEDNQLLHPSLYGARPGRGALEPVFVEELVNEITRQSRKPVIKNAEDATACYDRIIPGVGNLASRSHGLHRNVAIVQGSTLQEVKYHLKTQLGVTDEYYQHCTISPIYGTGQGSGNSPTVWLVVSSILFRCYSATANGARFESPDGSVIIDLYRVGFVDDTCCYVNLFRRDTPPDPIELIQLLQHDSQLWSDLLWKSGGALELPKCTYHYSQYDFAVDGTPYLRSGRIGPAVEVKTGDGATTLTVPSCSVYQAYKTLGCFKSPSGAQNTQYQKLEQKCLKHARIVSTSALSRVEGWTYYYSKYLPSVSYSLPVCHFPVKKLIQLEKKVLPAIFSSCGFNRNTSRNILFGPTRLNGAGYRPLSTEQGVSQLQLFVKHWNHQQEPGQLLRIAVAWAQVNTGVGYSILENVVPSLPHIESKWLDSLRHFLRLIDGKLRLNTTYVPEIQRVNDSYIMDHVLERGSFTRRQIQKINYCRLYLQAVTVSDISIASGDSLAPGVLYGEPTIWSGTTRYHKTNQCKPDPATWRLWSRAMKLIATPDGTLRVPLLQWIVPPHQQRQSWIAYYDPSSDSLYIRKQGVYEIHQQNNGSFPYTYTSLQSIVPPTAYPVSLLECDQGWQVQKYSSYCPALPKAMPSSFMSFCSLLEDWESRLLQTVTLHFNPFNIVELLEYSTFQACSDGSAVAFEGTYGWVLSTKDGTRLAHGAGPVDGHDPRSFRAEGQGMLSVVCLLRRIKQWTCSVSTITGVLATDNTGLIDRVTAQTQVKYPVPNAVFKPDWDVVQAICDTQKLFSISVEYVHVKGHQDKEVQFDDLDLLAQLNVEADRYAGEYRLEFGEHRPIIPLSPTRPVALDIDGKTIHRGFRQAIRDAIHGPHLLEEMQLRYDWPDGTLESIDWEVHRQATYSQNARKTHYVKLCHEQLPTGQLVSKYGQGLPDYCPLCKTPGEDFHHVLRCQHHTRCEWRTETMDSLKKCCYELKTDPMLVEILLDGIQSWLDGTPWDTSEFPIDYLTLIREQGIIGWAQVFQGRITTQWAVKQQYYYNGFPPVKGRDGSSWSRKILIHIFTCWNQLWDARNKAQHGEDQSTKAIALHDQAIRELELLYSHRHLVLPRDRKFYYDDLDNHKSKPTSTIRQWINTHQPLILKSVKDAKKRSLQNVQSLKTYFGAK